MILLNFLAILFKVNDLNCMTKYNLLCFQAQTGVLNILAEIIPVEPDAVNTAEGSMK